jgi:hypothetical protein
MNKGVIRTSNTSERIIYRIEMFMHEHDLAVDPNLAIEAEVSNLPSAEIVHCSSSDLNNKKEEKEKKEKWTTWRTQVWRRE